MYWSKLIYKWVNIEMIKFRNNIIQEEKAVITEAVLTTVNSNKTPHFAAVGIKLTADRAEFYLYKSSKTAENLINTKKGVINITDSALHIVKSALAEPDFEVKKTADTGCFYLKDSCRYLEFNYAEAVDKKEKYFIRADIISRKNLREYRGFNRASNLLVEAAVMASRIGISCRREEVKNFLEKKRRIIIKTAGEDEIKCYNFLKKYLKYPGG